MSKEATDDYPRIPAKFAREVSSFPECSYGAVRVTLVLKNVRVTTDVILGDDSIAKIGHQLVRSPADLDFPTEDIEKVLRG